MALGAGSGPGGCITRRNCTRTNCETAVQCVQNPCSLFRGCSLSRRQKHPPCASKVGVCLAARRSRGTCRNSDPFNLATFTRAQAVVGGLPWASPPMGCAFMLRRDRKKLRAPGIVCATPDRLASLQHSSLARRGHVTAPLRPNCLPARCTRFKRALVAPLAARAYHGHRARMVLCLCIQAGWLGRFRSIAGNLEPPAGFAPATVTLQRCCTAVVLRRLYSLTRITSDYALIRIRSMSGAYDAPTCHAPVPRPDLSLGARNALA